ncbi:MAG: putative methyltransferase [Chloroflexi bacterium]|nr:putative methyltransferase [Chloroflexota bacterium]
MKAADRFDELAAGLGWFYGTWAIALGLELGLFARLREAGPRGLTTDELAAAAGCAVRPIGAWCRAAFATELLDHVDGRFILGPETATILLDEERPEYLGGQFVYAAVSSLDWDHVGELFRTGRHLDERPPRYWRAIEQLTRQDTAIFFEEALAALPDLVTVLLRGGRAVDVHCGGGRWLAAMARRFPELELLGIESEPDNVARAMRLVQERQLEDRVRIEARDEATLAHPDQFDLAYFQHALHKIERPADALAAAWRALRAGGWLLVLGWCLPERTEEYDSIHGLLISGVDLDEQLGGARLRTVAEHADLFRSAGLPEPTDILLPSGATLLVARRGA